MKKIMERRLVSNIISLLILQGSNYIFPLITFPYLVRTLGIDNYGVLVFCTTFMQYLNIFVDYGFNISGTRDIAINKNSKEIINQKYNVIMTIKIIFAILIGIIYFMIIGNSPFFNENKKAYYTSYLIIIGNTLFPLWLFQGLEKMKYITYINLLVKVVVTILIFVFIKNNDDLNTAIFIQTLYYLIPGLISVFFVKLKLKINFKLILHIRRLSDEIIKGKHFFMTNLWINFYSQGPIVILGFLSGTNATGNFSIGQKIYGAFSGIFHPIVQAVYPFLCDLHENDQEKFHKVKKKLLIYFLLSSILISLTINIFSNHIVELVTGTINHKIIKLLRLFSLIIFFGVMNTIIARIMYAMNLQRILNKSYSIAAISFMLLSFPLTLIFHEFGMAIAVILAESIVFGLNIRNMMTTREKIEKNII